MGWPCGLKPTVRTRRSAANAVGRADSRKSASLSWETGDFRAKPAVEPGKHLRAASFTDTSPDRSKPPEISLPAPAAQGRNWRAHQFLLAGQDRGNPGAHRDGIRCEPVSLLSEVQTACHGRHCKRRTWDIALEVAAGTHARSPPAARSGAAITTSNPCDQQRLTSCKTPVVRKIGGVFCPLCMKESFD